MPNPHGSFIWYELLTSDHGAAKSFYDAAVGWDIETAASNPMDYRMIRTGSGFAGGVMQLTADMREHGAKPTWLGYVGVDDVDATVAKAEGLGAKVMMPAFDLPGVGRMALIADPQGIPIYVMRGESDEASEAFSPDELGHGAWNELNTTDLEAAKSFYPELFGWSLGDVMPMGEMGDYQFIEHGGRMIGAMMKVQPGSQPTWNYCFRTDSVDRGLDAINAGGGTVTYGPAEVPGGDRVVQAIDPEGAVFMIVSK
ncbi:MAG: VOC family protein [Pseudomonadota bacterium]|nr:VOC family protein [Pseudomonadota bacterium]